MPSHGGRSKVFRLVAEFDLGDDKTAVVAREDVHLPQAALPANGEPCLFDQARMAEPHQPSASGTETAYSSQMGLTQERPRCGMFPPVLAADQELPFDLDCHGPPPFGSFVECSEGDGLLVTWLSAGQMSHPYGLIGQPIRRRPWASHWRGK